MNITLNSGLSFIKHVDCGREVSKEAHRVLIKIKENCRLLEWELCYLANIERQMVAFATEDDFFFVNRFLFKR